MLYAYIHVPSSKHNMKHFGLIECCGIALGYPNKLIQHNKNFHCKHLIYDAHAHQVTDHT